MYIEVTPGSPENPAEVQVSQREFAMIEPQPTGLFGRGLAFGLALGLSFWTFVAIELFSR